MRAHLQEAPVIVAVLPNEDSFHGRLHVVVDAALARLPEEGERPVMGIVDHFRLVRAPAAPPAVIIDFKNARRRVAAG